MLMADLLLLFKNLTEDLYCSVFGLHSNQSERTYICTAVPDIALQLQ